MDIDAVMLRAAASLNAMADTCQYLEQKAELRERAQELLNSRVYLAELIEACRPFNNLIGGRSIRDTITVHRVDVAAMAFYRLQEALAHVGGANG
jgi:hypothetical protein